MKPITLMLIGGGNMGSAMATRWRKSGATLHVVETDATRRDAFAGQGITSYEAIPDNIRADAVILAIKPQQFGALVPNLKRSLSQHTPLLISIMAGVPLSTLTTITPHAVRVMPNLPATIGESMSVLCAPGLDSASRQTAELLFEAIGKTAWVEDENQLHAVTAISGSGPAYVFALMEAMVNAATLQGLNATLAQTLVTQTVFGAAKLAEGSSESPDILRQRVTSKGGTTEAALAALQKAGFENILTDAVEAAARQSQILSK